MSWIIMYGEIINVIATHFDRMLDGLSEPARSVILEWVSGRVKLPAT